jgi:hypothetical protein
MTRYIHVFLLSFLLFATPALAQVAGDGGQARMDELRAQLASGKQAYVSRQMALDSAEETDFWPVYDEHQRSLEALQQRRREHASDYARAVAAGTLDEDFARDLARDLVEIETEEARLLDRTYSRLRRSLTEVQALKYLQIEARLAALLRYELAASLP